MGHANSPCNCAKTATGDADDPFALDTRRESDAFEVLSGDAGMDEAQQELDELSLDDEVLASQELDALLDDEDGGGEVAGDDLGALVGVLERYPGLQITLSRTPSG